MGKYVAQEVFFPADDYARKIVFPKAFKRHSV